MPGLAAFDVRVRLGDSIEGVGSVHDRLQGARLSQRSRLGGVEVSGYVGLDLLARNVIKVDTVNQRIQVVKPAKK